jgi:hypothetical protein
MWAAFPLGEELTDEGIVRRPRWVAAPTPSRCHDAIGVFYFHVGKLTALQARLIWLSPCALESAPERIAVFPSRRRRVFAPGWLLDSPHCEPGCCC